MFRRQLINTIRRYSHQHCEKNIPQLNIPQINSNQYSANNEQKLDLIQKQIVENNEEVIRVHGKLDIVFLYTCVSTIILFYKSI
jgi:hypothetical protein